MRDEVFTGIGSEAIQSIYPFLKIRRGNTGLSRLWDETSGLYTLRIQVGEWTRTSHLIGDCYPYPHLNLFYTSKHKMPKSSIEVPECQTMVERIASLELIGSGAYTESG